MSKKKKKDTEDINNQTVETAEKPDNDSDELLIGQQKKIDELQQQVDEMREAHLRRAAEFDNMKKRLNRDRDLIYEQSRAAAVEAFLPVYDDLLRTLKALKDAKADPSFIQGIQLVADKFDEVLKRYGVERIDQTGVLFDVDLHDALLRQKSDDESIKSDIVMQIIENGYRMGDKTLRHAKVIVSE